MKAIASLAALRLLIQSLMDSLKLRPRLGLLACLFVFACSPLALAQQNIGSLPEVDYFKLSDRSLGPLAQAALQIRARDWKHAETANFIYHYFQSHVATPVSVECEFYYKVIAQELGKDTTQWERKCHIYVFDQEADWTLLKQRGMLDPWTGGLHTGNEVFIYRDASAKWKGNTLGHEVAHLVVHRFFGPGIPLWLNEGFAENVSLRGWAAFFRARGYLARPKSQAISPQMFLSLALLTGAQTYPSDPVQVDVFYNQSERLVRFLSAADKKGFQVFFESMSKGNRFDTALSKGFGSRFASTDVLEREFREYATKEHGTTLQD
jgi:hypothetical protein